MPLPAQLSHPVDVVLHVGMGKTGTSSVQFFLRDHREALVEAGLLYPMTPGRGRHHKLSLSVKSDEELARSPEWARLGQNDSQRFRRRFRRKVLTEVEESGLSRVLFSDEVLFGSSYPALRRLGTWLTSVARTLRVVVYLRRQDEHLVSRYQEEVKLGETRRLDSWARLDYSGLYDYHTRLRRHTELLTPTELVVRRYERDRFPDGSVLQDFLDAVGVDLDVGDVAGGDRNVGLDAESLEFLRLLNLHRVEHESATPGLIDNRDLVARLAEVSTGPRATLPDAAMDRFMAQWELPNELVAREFLGDDSGTLFRLARKSGGTTTAPRLDPARVDELLEVGELPRDLRAPLRSLAERESASE
jgi:hypothetical protein